MDIHAEINAMGDKALLASRELALLTSRKKNSILLAMAEEIDSRKSEIIEANKKDITEAENAGLAAAMIDRLLLNEARITAMTKGLRSVADLKDPIGTRISRWIRPNGLEISKIRVPIGVIGIIYESRPNVTADTSALCIKTSNAIILRGGKEAIHSNTIIAEILSDGGTKKGLPANSIQFIKSTDYAAITELVQLDGKVDLIIPRGGEKLIRAVTEQALVPVIKHYKGVCHTYVDESANIDMAVEIAENAKCHRPGVCNAMETLLVHKSVAEEFLPKVADVLQKREVELRGDNATKQIIADIKDATEDDWYEEFLDLTLAVRVVSSVKEAVEHINTYGSRHSDAIIADSEDAQKAFTSQVDSSTVYINASTRFTDGGEFGMGAEIGISTDKLHARGPMGLEELTTYKYVIFGKGQVRE